MAERTMFEDFARQWLLANAEAYADSIVDLMLKGPIGRVPTKFRPVAKAIRVIRDGGTVKYRTGKKRR